MTKLWGARPLRRVVETEIRDSVTDFYLDNIDVKHLLADVKDGHIVITEKVADDAVKAEEDNKATEENKNTEENKTAEDNK